MFEEYVELKDKRLCNTHSSLEYEEMVRLVKYNLNLLPMQQKIIVGMAKFDQLTPAEIAGKLGISVQTVRNQLSAGMKKLRELLSGTIMLLLLFFIK